jgi:hypothetical protein
MQQQAGKGSARRVLVSARYWAVPGQEGAVATHHLHQCFHEAKLQPPAPDHKPHDLEVISKPSLRKPRQQLVHDPPYHVSHSPSHALGSGRGGGIDDRSHSA